MKMTNEEYRAYVKAKMPTSPLGKDMLRAFYVGGLICCLGQGFMDLYTFLGQAPRDAAAFTSVSLIFLGALLTGLGVYDDIAKFAGAGTLVPITGFANSVVAPAVEFKAEGLITGMAAKMFIISGPVIVFGVAASMIYGLLLILFGAA